MRYTVKVSDKTQGSKGEVVLSVDDQTTARELVETVWRTWYGRKAAVNPRLDFPSATWAKLTLSLTAVEDDGSDRSSETVGKLFKGCGFAPGEVVTGEMSLEPQKINVEVAYGSKKFWVLLDPLEWKPGPILDHLSTLPDLSEKVPGFWVSFRLWGNNEMLGPPEVAWSQLHRSEFSPRLEVEVLAGPTELKK